MLYRSNIDNDDDDDGDGDDDDDDCIHVSIQYTTTHYILMSRVLASEISKGQCIDGSSD